MDVKFCLFLPKTRRGDEKFIKEITLKECKERDCLGIKGINE
jgi:hypothetical protein